MNGFEDFVFDRAMPVILMLLVCGLVGFLGIAALDGVQSVRSYDAALACQQRQMASQRKPLTATVTCVPVPARRDTTAIQVLPASDD